MSLDLFTINRSFYIGSRYTFKTAFGGFLSIIFTLFIIPVTYFLSADLLNGTNPFIDQYAVNFIDDWEAPKLPVMVTFPKEFLNKTLLLEWDSSISNYYVSNMTSCTDEEISYMLDNIPKNNSLLYFCKTYTEVNLDYYEVSLINCANRYKSSKFNPKNVTTCTGEFDQNITDYTVYVGLSKLDKSRRNDPIVKDIRIYSTRNDYYNYASIEYNIHKLQNDVGLFFNYTDISYYYALNAFYGYSHNNNVLQHLFLVHVPLYWYYVVDKSYIKLQNHLTGLLSILKLLFLMFNYVNWNDFFYCKYFLNLHITKNVKLLRLKYLNELRKRNIAVREQVVDTKSFEKEVLNIYSFKNYLLSFLPFVNTFNIIRFRLLTDIIKHYISIDNVVDNYATINQVNSLPDERPMIVDSVFSKIDIFFAMDRNLYINKQQRVITKSGVLLTIFYFVLWIPIFVVFGLDFLINRNPKIRRYIQYNRDIVGIPDNHIIDIPLMFEISKGFAETTALLKYNSSNINPYAKVDYHVCSEEEYYRFNKTEPMNATLSYYCTNLDNILYSNYYSQGYSFSWISFVNCTSLETYNLTDENCSKNSPVPPGEPLFFSANYISNIFKNEYDNFIGYPSAFINNTFNYNKAERFYFNIDFTPMQLRNDKDHLFTNYTTYNFYEQTWVYMRNVEGLSLGNHIDIYFRVWDYNIIIERSYHKLPDTLAKIFAVIDVVYVVLFLANLLVSRYYFHEYFIKYFFKHLDLDSLEVKVNRKLSTYSKNSTELEKINQEKGSENVELDISSKDNIQRLKEYKELYTVGNYLKAKILCCCYYKDKQFIIFNCLYKDLGEYLSIENISTFSKLKMTKKNVQQHRSLAELFVTKTNNVLKAFDLFTYKKVFYLNSGSVFKTKIGGILSCIYLILLFIFFYLFAYDFWARANPTVSTIQMNYNDIVNSSDLWNLNIPVVIGYPKDIENMTRLENLYPLTPGVSDFGLNPCTMRDFRISNMHEINNTLDYICFNAKDILRNHFKSEDASTTIQLKNCSSTDKKACIYNEDINKPIYIEYRLNTTFLNYTKLDDFLIQENLSYNYSSKFSQSYSDSFSIKHNIFTDDRGLIIPDEKQYIYASLRKHIAPSISNGFKISLGGNTNEITTVKRIFKKFPDALAQVMAMLSFVNIVMRVIYNILVEYLYMKYFLKKMLSKVDIKDLMLKVNRKLSGVGKYVLNIEEALDEDKALTSEQKQKAISELYEIATLKNFILFKTVFVFYKNTQLLKLSVLFDEFLNFLSMENLINYDNRELANENNIDNIDGKKELLD
jgi:hypothetical protein